MKTDIKGGVNYAISLVLSPLLKLLLTHKLIQPKNEKKIVKDKRSPTQT